MPLRLLANTFVPGVAKHVVKKRISWNPIGITAVRRFIIEPCDALPKRELKSPPVSEIKNKNKEEAVPFNIPDATIEEITNLISQDSSLEEIDDMVDIDNYEEFIDWGKYQVLTEDTIEQIPLNNPIIDEIDWSHSGNGNPIISNFKSKGSMRMWCE